jgi:hypothetical protein
MVNPSYRSHPIVHLLSRIVEPHHTAITLILHLEVCGFGYRHGIQLPFL